MHASWSGREAEAPPTTREKEGYQTLADRFCKLYTRLGVWLCGLEKCGVVGRQKGEEDDVDPYVIC
jgi:hypothetical protein